MPESQNPTNTPQVTPASQPTQIPRATDTLHFEKWINELGERKGTDLHLSVGNVPMIRVDGAVEPLLDEALLTVESMEAIVQSLLTENELKQLGHDRQIVVSRTLKKIMRFRIHVMYSRGFLAVSLRHLPDTQFTLETSGLPPMVKEFVTAENGLYIIGGPFDAGRTTAMRTIVSEINNTQKKYIVTLEEPVEYLIPSATSIVVQREIGTDVARFEDGLRALHDEDVDVVVLGALRGGEVLEEVIKLASTGRLVIAIADGSHAVGILESLRDSVPPENRQRVLNTLADVLLGMTTQVLLPRVGGGRVLIAEALRATNPITSLIKENKLALIPNVMQTSRQEGMITMDKALVEAIKQGVVTLQDAKEYAIDLNQFNMLAAH